MPKPKPRKGWRAHQDLPENPNPYSEDDLEHIIEAVEKGLEREIEPRERKYLLGAVQRTAREFTIVRVRQKGPKKGEIKATLINLRIALDNLSQVAEGLDDATIIALVQQRGEFYEAAFGVREQNLSPSECLIGSLSFVSALSAEASEAIKALDNPRPHSLKIILDLPRGWLGVYPINYDQSPTALFIGWLADIFYELFDQEPECRRDWTREKNYVGNFPPFVEACLTPLENRERTALGRTIQDALREWREWRKWRDAKAETDTQIREDEGTE